MGMLDDLITKMESISGLAGDGTLVMEALEGEGENAILELQKDQLSAGLNSDGEYISPLMNNDPYFKGSARAFARYADYKQRKFAGTRFEQDRPYAVPNLNLGKGIFWDSLFVEYTHDSLLISVYDTPLGARGETTQTVYDKYGEETFGLTEENWNIIRSQYIIPYIASKIATI